MTAATAAHNREKTPVDHGDAAASLIYARLFSPPRNPFKMESIIIDPLL